MFGWFARDSGPHCFLPYHDISPLSNNKCESFKGNLSSGLYNYVEYISSDGEQDI